MDETRGGLKSLASRYAAMFFIMPLNYLFSAYIFLLPASLILSAVTGSSAIDKSTGYGYMVTFVLNAFMSYAIPLLAALLLFGRYVPRFGERPLLEGYTRYPLDTVALFFAGIFSASIGSIVTSYVSGLLNTLFGTPRPEQVFSDIMPTSGSTFAVMAVSTVIVAPLCEELLYRHFLLKPLRKYGDAAAVVVSALMFSLSHFNFDQMLYTFLLGMFLGIIVVRSGSVIPALICHSLNNISAVLQSYLPESFGNDTVDSVFGSLSDIAGTVAQFAFFIGLAALILALVLKMLRLNTNCELSAREQFGIIFGSPAVIIGIIITIALTAVLLYA